MWKVYFLPRWRQVRHEPDTIDRRADAKGMPLGSQNPGYVNERPPELQTTRFVRALRSSRKRATLDCQYGAMRYWAERRIRISGVGRIDLPEPTDMRLLDDLDVVSISVSQADPEPKYPDQTHCVRVEFDGEAGLKDHLTMRADEILDRVVDVVSLVAGLGVAVFSGSCGWIDEDGMGNVVLRPVGEAASGSTHTLDLAGQPLSFGATERERRAIRYLRRGLSAPDLDERFNYLMLAVMVLARGFEVPLASPTVCERCGEPTPHQGVGERAYLLNLANVIPNRTEDQLKSLWDLRNRFPGHGREHLDKNAQNELAHASVGAAELAFEVLSAASPDTFPDRPHPLWRMEILALSGVELVARYHRKPEAEEEEGL